MPKCEIFDRPDFYDFYTIKSLWGGRGGTTLGLKLKNLKKYLGVHAGPQNA
jgi:hypothetical protein